MNAIGQEWERPGRSEERFLWPADLIPLHSPHHFNLFDDEALLCRQRPHRLPSALLLGPQNAAIIWIGLDRNPAVSSLVWTFTASSFLPTMCPLVAATELHEDTAMAIRGLSMRLEAFI